MAVAEGEGLQLIRMSGVTKGPARGLRDSCEGRRRQSSIVMIPSASSVENPTDFAQPTPGRTATS